MGAQREQTISNTSAFVLKTSARPPVIIAPSAGGHTPSERCPLRESRNEVGQSLSLGEAAKCGTHNTHGRECVQTHNMAATPGGTPHPFFFSVFFVPLWLGW